MMIWQNCLLFLVLIIGQYVFLFSMLQMVKSLSFNGLRVDFYLSILALFVQIASLVNCPNSASFWHSSCNFRVTYPLTGGMKMRSKNNKIRNP